MIEPNDERHGTTRGFHAGCRDTCCRTAISRYEKGSKYRKVAGIAWAIPALGCQRRIQALMRLGWTTTDIAEAAGYKHRNHLFRILKGQKGKPCRWVERKTYRTIADVYERLSMSIPPHTPTRARTRSLAAKKGYAPPLCWDDIDRDEAPMGMRTSDTRDLLAEWQDLQAAGESIEQAAVRLGVTVGAIERAEYRRSEKERAA